VTTVISWLSLLALGVLALFCLPRDTATIARQLEASTSAAIAAAPVAGVATRADGRDIVLTGTVASEALKTQAGQIAAEQPGVRTVANLLEIVAAPPASALAVVPDASAVQSKLRDILLKKKIEFDTARATITAASFPVLEEARSVLSDAPQLGVVIEGHTDNRGDAAANRALSRARAQAVVDWLKEHGIAPQRLRAEGFGPDRPIADNDTSAGRAQNRRVEITAQ
jgi:outer membrane protein OmpA-like peptidoglycan-associated protein